MQTLVLVGVNFIQTSLLLLAFQAQVPLAKVDKVKSPCPVLEPGELLSPVLLLVEAQIGEPVQTIGAAQVLPLAVWSLVVGSPKTKEAPAIQGADAVLSEKIICQLPLALIPVKEEVRLVPIPPNWALKKP